MKGWLVSAAAWLGVLLSSCERQSDKSERSDKSNLFDQSIPPTSTHTDATEVFKRAFWKRPTETDRILHAERREWAGEDGVDRWQWFIAVDPSEELSYYLKEQNPFGMAAPEGGVVMPSEPRPAWFPKSAAGLNAWQTRDGKMLFLTNPDTGRIYASSEGRGFAKPVEVTPAPIRPARESAPSRLPTTPPPSLPDS